jgi:hypothetical protein
MYYFILYFILYLLVPSMYKHWHVHRTLCRTLYSHTIHTRARSLQVVDQHYLIWSLAWGMFNALVMILDATSDLYLCMQLYVDR